MTGAAKLARLSPAERDTVLTLLDELSAPLGVRDLDVAFAKAGIPRTVRRPLMRSLLEDFDLIAVVAR
ncbi:hypothetical protein [Sphingomonas qomolangmaensis]|uniref:Uncharacterized protein n=1 Tax=Sphingomonas qomolangmaensis TaxID=2918765 RepID=A0ABY5L900_9SPHN|nr:hypothetical protein [Sphingomonas qomolangmaensis]UUL82230.1 hypothetical protein NMP03_13740 [Sphingomonas qomolangmaensis]